jgi:hypothetical protein
VYYSDDDIPTKTAALQQSAPDLCMVPHDTPTSIPGVASAVPVFMLEAEAEQEDVLFIRGTAQRSTIRHSEKKKKNI